MGINRLRPICKTERAPTGPRPSIDYGRSPSPTRLCARSARAASKLSSMKHSQTPTSGRCTRRSHDNEEGAAHERRRDIDAAVPRRPPRRVAGARGGQARLRVFALQLHLRCPHTDRAVARAARGDRPMRRRYPHCNKIDGPFAPRLITMLKSPAYRALSLSAHRILARLEIELYQHGGEDNGKLIVTYDHFVEHGIDRDAIAPALRELEALGFIEIPERG